MKVLKLNRRWRQFKENGHTMCFRFDGWDKDATAVEKALRDLTDEGGWVRNGQWYSYFGSMNSQGRKPYFITVQDENLVSMVLLKSGVQHETSSV